MLIQTLLISKILTIASAIVASTNRTLDSIDFVLTHPHGEEYSSQSNKCTTRLHTSLEKLRRRQANLKSTGFIDLSGYALHQTLRFVPLDMYVTDIRVKTPGVGDWVRIQKCQFSNRDNRMSAQILFNDMTVSGTVRLLDDTEVLKNSQHPIPRELCKMSLRLQRAGLGINAFPTRGRSRGIEVRTEARFMDPKFLSVHAYGCKLNDIFKRSDEENAKDVAEMQQNQTEILRRLRRYRSEYGISEEQPEVRIITLNPDVRTSEDLKWSSLHREEDFDLNEFHRQRILSMRLHAPTERDRLKGVLHIRNLIAQQTNHVFQTQGPFSQTQPMFKPIRQTFQNTNLKPVGGHAVVGTITELDENLSPVRPVPQRPFEALFRPGEPIDNHPNHPNHPVFNHNYEEVTKEVEDIFLRGIKTLLAKYVEKQLQIPMKEALMVNYGYTVSYG